MPKSKFDASRMIFLLQQLKKDVSIRDICANEGISQATFYNWKKMLEQQQLREANEKLIKQLRRGSKSNKVKPSSPVKTKAHQKRIEETDDLQEIAEMELLDTLTTIIASILLKEVMGISDEDGSLT
jgi:transposase-like protein